MVMSGGLQVNFAKRPQVFMIPWTFQKSNLFLKYFITLYIINNHIQPNKHTAIIFFKND